MQQPDFVINTTPVILSYLYQEGYLGVDTENEPEFVDWLAEPETELKGKHIFGFVPFSMAKHAESVTILNYDTSIFREDAETVTSEKFAEAVIETPQTYTVRECEFAGIDIITSRHTTVQPYLYRKGIINPKSGIPVVARASLQQIVGKNVFGQLPLHLACLTNTMSKFPMKVPKEWRHRELSMKELSDCITGNLETFKVEKIS